MKKNIKFQIYEDSIRDRAEEIQGGVEDYTIYYIPKSGLSNNEVKELSKYFKVWEEEITDSMMEDGIDNIEKLGENERWHYAFSKLEINLE